MRRGVIASTTVIDATMVMDIQGNCATPSLSPAKPPSSTSLHHTPPTLGTPLSAPSLPHPSPVSRPRARRGERVPGKVARSVRVPDLDERIRERKAYFYVGSMDLGLLLELQGCTTSTSHYSYTGESGGKECTEDTAVITDVDLLLFNADKQILALLDI